MHDYYMKKKNKILKSYGKLTNKAESILLESYDKDTVSRIIKTSEKEYENIIPRLPFIGGKDNVMTPIIEFNGWIVSIYKAMKKEDIDTRVVAYVSREVFHSIFNKVPRSLGILIGKIPFTRMGIKFFKKQAAKSQKRIYPEDFVYTVDVIKKEGKEVEVEFEFQECAVHKFYEAEDAFPLKSFCNFGDPIYSDRFEMGVNADHTFAQGCQRCKLNYNNKRKTYTPSNVQQMIEDAQEIMK